MIPLTIITRWWGAGLGAAAAAASKKSWPAESTSVLKQPRLIRRSSSILRERLGRAGLDPGSKQKGRSSERVGSRVGTGGLGRSTEPESEASMKEGLMLFAWFSLFSTEWKAHKVVMIWFGEPFCCGGLRLKGPGAVASWMVPSPHLTSPASLVNVDNIVLLQLQPSISMHYYMTISTHTLAFESCSRFYSNLENMHSSQQNVYIKFINQNYLCFFFYQNWQNLHLLLLLFLRREEFVLGITFLFSSIINLS